MSAESVASIDTTTFDIFVPQPRALQLTQTMIEDFICDPAMAAYVIFGEVMDEFQKQRVFDMMWVPRVMDSSGYSSAKTRTMFIAMNLRCILIEDHVCGVFYQNFSAGQRSFWPYYDMFRRRSPIFRAQLGRTAVDSVQVEGKATTKMPSCYNAFFRNGSHLMLPAPDIQRASANQASTRLNDIVIDEWTKVEATGSTSIDDQLLNRASRECFNQDHPFWCNHHVFTATAEDTLHPAYERYRVYERNVRNGNPYYSMPSYSFKDYSDLPSFSGKTFKKALRESNLLRDLWAKWTKSKKLQEGLGIWSKNGRRWYDQDDLDRCVELGRKRELVPLIDRKADPRDSEKVRYFLGVDPAKGEKKKSDDGAMVVLRAEQLTEDFSETLTDWRLDYVWAFKVRKADATQWASVIHQKEKHFKFSGICMDHGGGGQWIKDELAKSKQMFSDVPTKVIPITTPDDVTTATNNPCLIMFSHGDDSIARKWEHLKGADNLIDAAHLELNGAIEHAMIGWPQPFSDFPKDVLDSWGEGSERWWASKLLDLSRRQLASISVVTNEDGTFAFTKNNARSFECKGRKDFAYACVHAYVRFLVWLSNSDHEYAPSKEDEAMGE